MNHNHEESIISLYEGTKGNEIELPTGEIVYGDLEEFYEVVDFFASRYGLGGCKSLEEFADMVDQTDPMFLNCLRHMAIQNHNKMWGGDDKDVKNTSEGIPQHRETNKTTSSKPRTSSGRGKHNMAMFLTEMGADKDSVKEATKKLDSRKIELKDYSWLTPTALENMSPIEFKQLMADMQEDSKKCINFNVSLKTLQAKERRD